jgi:formylglycine-generating enzyme
MLRAPSFRSPICVHLCPSVVASVSALLCLLLLPVAAETNTVPARVPIPAGIYRPSFRSPDDLKEVPVAAFELDAVPASNGDYLDFVRANPRWRRSQVKRLFADENYLRHWAGDLDLGTNAAVHARQPVTWVSWFAAKAYAQWVGGRLPTTAEWELAASAGFTRPDGTNDLEYRRMVADWYSAPSPALLPSTGSGQANYHGVHDLQGLVWEWTADFNNALVSGDARGDTGLDRQLFCGAGAQTAADRSDFQAFLRYGFRSSLKAAYTVHNLGFRCAYDRATTTAPPEKTP